MSKTIIKSIFCIGAVLSAILAFADRFSPGESYDPTSPGDPNAQYLVMTECAPSQAGYISNSSSLHTPGENVSLTAYENSNFKFAGWYDGATLVSTDRTYSFVMPAKTVKLTAFYDYDPDGPGDPMEDAYTHRVRIFMDPATGGYTSYSQYFLMREGETRTIWAYPNQNFKFGGWKIDGVNVAPNTDGSIKNPIEITMGNKNIDLTARFTYDPASPADPMANSYNPDTFELIMDNFEPGNLYWTIRNLIEGDRYRSSMSDVHSVIVVGPMDYYDLDFTSVMPNLSKVDLGRTSSIATIRDHAFNRNESITEIILPSSIQMVQNYAFYNCSNLSKLTVYAPVPPKVDGERFEGLNYVDGIVDGLVCRVPAASLPLYKEAPGWKYLYLVPMESDDCSITVNLPSEAKDGRYKGMSLVLENPASGQTQRFVINDRLSYEFENLIMNTSGVNLAYNIYLRTPEGDELAYYPDITLTAENPKVTVDLADIKDFHTLEVEVLQEDGKNVAGDLDIVWRNSTNEHVATGVKAVKVVEGKVLSIKVGLPDSYGTVYEIPAVTILESGKNDNKATIQLKAYPKEIAEGIVTDAFTGDPIEKAYVTVDQMLAGKYKKTATGVTGADGKYKLEYVHSENATGKVTCRAENYVTQPCEIKNFTDWKEMQDFEMKLISGAVINVSLVWKKAGENEYNSYADYNNVDFTLYNKSKDRRIYNISNQYPKIVILDDVNDGDQIQVTASSRTGHFEDAWDVTTINDDMGDVKIAFEEHGKINSTYSGSQAGSVVAALYDSNGHLVKHTLYDSAKKAAFSNLSAGEYTLVALADSPYFNGISSFGDYAGKYEFAEGEDYLVKKVTVKDGDLVTVDFSNVPIFDESRFYYTDPAQTLLKVNKTSVTAGNYITISTKFDFLPEYRGWMENVRLVFELPEHCTYVDNSVINGNDPGNLTYEGGNIYSLDNVVPGTTVRFCVMPEKGDNYYPTASIEFDYKGAPFTQALGSVYFQGVDFKLYVPQKTCRKTVWARGIATNGADVTVFANGVPSGAAHASGNGAWVTEVTLDDPEAHPLQQIYGEITDSKKGTFPTESSLIEYDPYYPELTYARMVHNGFAVDFDHTRVKTSAKSYSYNPDRDIFTLLAKFDENKESVKEVNFHILSTDGSEREIPGVYNSSNDAWVAALSYPDSYRLPVNVTVDFTYTKPAGNGGTTTADSYFYMDHIAPDVQPIIDPSGYVFEAEEDNRLPNVTVTVFHREAVESDNDNGLEWIVTKWDASEYDQENPLLTDKEGVYGWDVPAGDWQVKFEKEGYETAFSDWLPVPPPQLEVNKGMIRNDAPAVREVHAYAASNGVEIMFDHYMKPASLEGNIYILNNDEIVSGKLVSVRSESDKSESDVDSNTLKGFVKSVRFVPDAALSSTVGEIRLIVSRKVESYAGTQMGVDYNEPLTIEKEITSLVADSPSYELATGEKIEIIVSALPADAAGGKTLYISNQSPLILGMTGEKEDEEGRTLIVLDENGQARVNLEGLLAGQSRLDFEIEGSNISGSVPVDVLNEKFGIYVPYASLPDGSDIYRGTVVTLANRNNAAVIYYTTDGSVPTAENGIRYTGPITLNGDVTIRAIAVVDGEVSEIAQFTYTLKMGKMDIPVAEGWTWISHNMENPVDIKKVSNDNISRILSQTQEVTNDSKYGFVGNLKELEPDKSYKVKSAVTTSIPLEDVAYNPAQPISMKAGWNWVGYPVDQRMSVADALAETDCDDGDYIESLEDGFATYENGAWTGNLTILKPGTGYLYKSMRAKNLRFSITSEVNAAAVYASPRRVNSPWAVDKHKYAAIMPVIADVIKGDDTRAEADEFTVGAFCGSECRGIGTYVDGYLFISVNGEPGDKINFRLAPVGTDDEIEVKSILEFTEEPVGSLSEPYRIEAGETSVKSVKADGGVTVSVQNRLIYVSGTKLDHVAVFDLDGNKLRSVGNAGQSSVTVECPNVGVYIIAVENAGNWSYHKIIVK